MQCVTIRYVIENMWPKTRDISHFCSCIYNQIDATLDGATCYDTLRHVTIRYGLLSTEGHLLPPALLISVLVHDTLVKKVPYLA